MSDFKIPEAVAYQLMLHVLDVEKKVMHPNNVDANYQLADKALILKTYAECLFVTKVVKPNP